MIFHSSSIDNFFYWHTHRSEKYVLSDISSPWITLTTAYKIFMNCLQPIHFLPLCTLCTGASVWNCKSCKSWRHKTWPWHYSIL